MKVDIHNHILPREWPNLKERYGLVTGQKLTIYKISDMAVLSSFVTEKTGELTWWRTTSFFEQSSRTAGIPKRGSKTWTEMASLSKFSAPFQSCSRTGRKRLIVPICAKSSTTISTRQWKNIRNGFSRSGRFRCSTWNWLSKKWGDAKRKPELSGLKSGRQLMTEISTMLITILFGLLVRKMAECRSTKLRNFNLTAPCDRFRPTRQGTPYLVHL